MEAEWMADRIALRTLLREHPDWRLSDFAEAINRSLGWVKKWAKRLRAALPDDLTAVHSLSRARKTLPQPISPEVVERILDIRDHPPANLGRIPGPKAILYFLHQDQQLKSQATLPRSACTIWRILRRHQRITDQHIEHHPIVLPEPMTHWQLDFKDATTVPAEADGKQQHMVEVLNAIDVGTSSLVEASVRADFTAETALAAVASMLEHHGLPKQINLDRDPRWVGSQQQRDFPAPIVRFLLCLGIEVTICPPRRPDRNGHVERYHRTLDEECLQVYRPADLEQVQTVTQAFQQHYNYERPHQGRACQNQPPRVAFPVLPELPRLPEHVDPDHWLQAVDGQCSARRVGRDGLIRLDSHQYYVSTRLAGQMVSLRIDAATRELVVEYQGQMVKRLRIAGTGSGVMPYTEYVARMQIEARSDARRLRQAQARRRQLSFA